MAAAVVEPQAIEDSTYVITAAFTDEDGIAVIPNTITWSLKDEDGDVVNSRTAESIGTPAASVDIVLQGDDLEPGTSDVAKLLLSLTADYDSSLGSGLPLMAQCWIEVAALEPRG